MKKYELIPEGSMFRIRALIDIPAAGVRCGGLGGLVARESNLSHYDSCWVSGEAQVYGKAQVYGEALVSGEARVYGKAVVSVGKIITTPIVITGLCEFVITVHSIYIQIGCKVHTAEEWSVIESNSEYKTLCNGYERCCRALEVAKSLSC